MDPENKDRTDAPDVSGTEKPAHGGKKGFFATFSQRSLTERFLIILFAVMAVIALVTLVLVALSINKVFPEDMNENDPGSMNWYGYIIAVAIILCIVPGIYTSLKQGYYADIVFDYIIFAVPCAFGGAVLYYVATSRGGNGDIGLGVIGGLLGAAVGIVLAMLFWQKLMKHPKVTLPQLLDIAAPFVLFGQCVGRFGCYFAHCCYGIEVDWAFFPFSYSYDGGVTYHLGNPFIESIWCFIAFVPMLATRLSEKKSFNGFYISLYCIWYGIGRCILESFRAPGQKLQLAGGHGGGFGVSQLTSILMIAFGVVWIAQYVIRALVAKKKIMIFADRSKLSDDYFEYGKTIYAHPHVDSEGRPLTPDVKAAEGGTEESADVKVADKDGKDEDDKK